MRCGKCNNDIEYASDMGRYNAFRLPYRHQDGEPSYTLCYDGQQHCRPFDRVSDIFENAPKSDWNWER